MNLKKGKEHGLQEDYTIRDFDYGNNIANLSSCLIKNGVIYNKKVLFTDHDFVTELINYG